jgi:hypothetical protein
MHLRQLGPTFKLLMLAGLFLGIPLLLPAAVGDKKQASNAAGAGSSPIALTIDANLPGISIPENFSGISFETGSVRKGNARVTGNFFRAGNKQAINLFRQLGIRHLRIGGGSVDMNQTVPTWADIDSLFAFAHVAGVKVVYSLRLLNGNLEDDVAIARYIWDNYRSCLDNFEIGNEPDWNSYHTKDPEITDYPSYLAKWRKFSKAIIDVIPEARFSGPNTGSNYPIKGAKDTGYNGKSWTVNFARDEKEIGIISFIAQHNYVGQDANGLTVRRMIDNMLSEDWVSEQYPALYHTNLLPVIACGFPYRLIESNSFSGQVEGGSNCFATALFALDYMHWWSEHKCSGVNFHNKQWVKNAPIGMDADGNFQTNPVAYGIKAFDLGGHGVVLPVTLSNPGKINLTAYAVKGQDYLFVTVINKEHGVAAHEAIVTLPNQKPGHIGAICLKAPDNNPEATSGIMLGDAFMEKDGTWHGKWKQLIPDKDSQYALKIPASSAIIVRILTK